MKDLNLENATHGLCVVCGGKLTSKPRMLCGKCKQPCEPAGMDELTSRFDSLPKEKGTLILDIKSNCCNADVKFWGNITCSPVCHERIVGLRGERIPRSSGRG